MKVNRREFVLLVLDAAGGEIPGKTYFQKLCFFVGLKAGNSELGFSPHYYGPYSDAVANEISFLKGSGFISERRLGTGVADSSGWEMTRYDYSITDEGRRAVRILKDGYPNDCAAVTLAVSEVSAAGDVDYMALSIAAKTYWIVNQNKNAPVPLHAIAEQAQHLNWKISNDQVNTAIDFLTKLHLIETKALH